MGVEGILVADAAERAIGYGLAGFWIFCSVIGVLISLFLFVIWILMIVDCAKRANDEFPGGGENAKTIWLVLLIASWVIGLWWVAAIVYYFIVKRKMPRKA